ncbi:STAS domain-containing protein [Amycolatopsis sp. NPDC004368]
MDEDRTPAHAPQPVRPPRVVEAAGALDGASVADLAAGLLRLAGDVVVDLDGADFLSASGARVLLHTARELELAGQRLVLVTARPEVLRALDDGYLTEVVEVHPTRESALKTALPPRQDPAPSATWHEHLEVKAERLHARFVARQKIAQALGVLRERYDLPDDGRAFALLRSASQHANVPLRDLARTVLELPPPRAGARRWPDASSLPREPRLPFPTGRHRLSPTRALEAALRAAVRLLGADAGLVQLPSAKGLRSVAHHGLAPGLREQLSGTTAREMPSSVAARTRTRVVIADVGEAPLLSGTFIRELLLGAGFPTMQSTPVLDPHGGGCLAVLSTLHRASGRTPDETECAALDLVAAATASWLHWHRRMALLTAAAHCHTAAGRADVALG